VRAYHEKGFVEDAVDFDFQTMKESYLLDEIDNWEKAKKRAATKYYNFNEPSPLEGIDDKGVPVLTRDSAYKVWKRWIKAKVFAVRTCTTKASSRAQWKAQSKDWREPEEREAETREILAVHPTATIISPSEDNPSSESGYSEEPPDAEQLIREAEQMPPQKPVEKPVEKPPAPAPKVASGGETLIPEVMSIGKDEWGRMVESFKNTIFFNEAANFALAKQILEDEGRNFLTNIAKVFGTKLFTEKEVQSLFINAAVHKDPLYLRHLYGVLLAFLNVEKKPANAETWQLALRKAAGVK